MTEPRFKIGDVVRYNSGPTALMRIDSISVGERTRYYGTQYYGAAVGAYDHDCQGASAAEAAAWPTRWDCHTPDCEERVGLAGSGRCPTHSREQWHRDNPQTPEGRQVSDVAATRERALELARNLLGGAITLHGAPPVVMTATLAQAVLDYEDEMQGKRT